MLIGEAEYWWDSIRDYLKEGELLLLGKYLEQGF